MGGKGEHDKENCEACHLGICQHSSSPPLNRRHPKSSNNIQPGSVPISRNIHFYLSFADDDDDVDDINNNSNGRVRRTTANQTQGYSSTSKNQGRPRLRLAPRTVATPLPKYYSGNPWSSSRTTTAVQSPTSWDGNTSPSSATTSEIRRSPWDGINSRIIPLTEFKTTTEGRRGLLTELSSTTASDRNRESLIGPRVTQANTENIKNPSLGKSSLNTTNQPASADNRRRPLITTGDSIRMQSTTEYTRQNNDQPVRHLAPTVVVQNNEDTIKVVVLMVFGIIFAFALRCEFDPSFYSRRW